MNSDNMIKELWEEIIMKENIRNVINMVNDMKAEHQTLTRQIVSEELTKLWNMSEIPTNKIILEKLTNLEEGNKHGQISKGENSTLQPEIVPIKIWRRVDEPIMVDISRMKPRLSESANRALDGLALLQKQGKF